MKWYSNAWKYRKKITIDHTKVSGNALLVDFPLLINHIDSLVFNNIQSAGQDLLFTDQNGNKLNHEIENLDSSTKRLTCWVKIPSLSPFMDTSIFLYFGNPSCADQQNATAVWDSNYKNVYHLDDNGATVADSTSNAVTLSKISSSKPALSQSGIIGPSQSFDGTSAINATLVPAVPAQGSFQIEFWVRPTTFTNGLAGDGLGTYFLDRIPTGNPLFSLKAVGGLYTIQKRYDDGTSIGGVSGVGAEIDLGIAKKITMIRNYNSTFELRINGVSVATVADSTKALTVQAAKIGRHQDSVGGMTGLLEEYRVSSIVRTAAWDLTEYRNQSAPLSFYAIAILESNVPLEKVFLYKIFTAGVYVGTWTKEVISEPSFNMAINGGVGEITVVLARPFDDFGEDVDVKLNNKVECYVVDKDAPNGQLLYSGYISGYKPSVSEETEKVEITVLGYIAQLQRMLLEDVSGNTTIAYNSYDPSNILKDVIDKGRLQGLGISYTPSSIALTGTVVSYTFNTNTLKECLDKVIELCPVGWYWRVDANNVITLAARNVAADHSFALGLDIEKLETFRRIEDVVNRVFFTGAGTPALFKKYQNDGSRDSYGHYDVKITDQRVSLAATAAIVANRQIDSNKDPEIRSTFTIIDNNGPQDRGYDIESVHPGQTLRVKNLKTATKTVTLWDVGFWDIDVWDQTLATAAADVIQILSVNYTPDSIVIEASSRLPQIAKRIEDVQRNLDVTQAVNNPTSPS